MRQRSICAIIVLAEFYGLFFSLASEGLSRDASVTIRRAAVGAFESFARNAMRISLSTDGLRNMKVHRMGVQYMYFVAGPRIGNNENENKRSNYSDNRYESIQFSVILFWKKLIRE